MFSILSDDSLPSFTSSVEEALPTLNPAVEDALLEFLRVEVSEYIISLHGTKCELCPFRVVSSFKYLKKHLKKLTSSKEAHPNVPLYELTLIISAPRPLFP